MSDDENKTDKQKPTEPQVYRLVCHKCGKIIIGLTEGQAQHNMSEHLKTHDKKVLK
ncbi:MAG: hypothetical protein QXG73_02080 [Candidatus Micrarchaeaceae archaeon]